MKHVNPGTLGRARNLRRQQTYTEQQLWNCLRSRQFENIKFRRQQPIGRFIVDFYCPSAKLIIEIDGDSHCEQVEYDLKRTAWLEDQGYQFIRFTNYEVAESIDAVAEAILECIDSSAS